jgi:hypothetical protein
VYFYFASRNFLCEWFSRLPVKENCFIIWADFWSLSCLITFQCENKSNSSSSADEIKKRCFELIDDLHSCLVHFSIFLHESWKTKQDLIDKPNYKIMCYPHKIYLTGFSLYMKNLYISNIENNELECVRRNYYYYFKKEKIWYI